jgi:hypothetical protein
VRPEGFKSMKISSDTIGNRIRDLPTYSAVHQPAAPPRTPRLQVIHSKCFRVVGNHPRHTSVSHMHHNTVNNEPIRDIHRLTAKFFAHCPSHANPLVKQTGNCTLAELTNMYRKYKHKRTKHILL